MDLWRYSPNNLSLSSFNICQISYNYFFLRMSVLSKYNEISLKAKLYFFPESAFPEAQVRVQM
jgi:hypothetical protein